MIEYTMRPGAEGTWAVERAIDGLAQVHLCLCQNQPDAFLIVTALLEYDKRREQPGK